MFDPSECWRNEPISSDRYYLDYNATSPLSQSVQNWLKSGDFTFANPASQHSLGKEARKVINQTRFKLYSTFGLSETEFKLFFHSGATEGITTFAHSFADWARTSGRELLICYSRLDHPAVTSLKDQLFGSQVHFLELLMDRNLSYLHQENISQIREYKKSHPKVVILYHHLWVHNETGIVSPLEDLLPLKSIEDLYVHVDAVQAPGKIVNWKELPHGDIFTFSPHKFGAFKGIGFSFFKNQIKFYPLISGGGQQQGLRSGTENALAIESISLALDDLEKVDILQTLKYRDELESFLAKELKDIGGVITSPGSVRSSNTIYFYLNKHASDVTLALFDLNGLMISAGSACSSGSAKESLVMLYHTTPNLARNGLRISLPIDFKDAEFEIIKSKIANVILKLK